MIQSKQASLLFSGSFLLLFFIASTVIHAQTVNMFAPYNALIPGQIVAYLPEDATPEYAKRLEDLDMEILKTDIKPVHAFISDPGESALLTIKQHPSVTEFEFQTFTYDSTTLKNLKFGDGMAEEEKEQAKKRFLESDDWVTAFVTFDYHITREKAEEIISGIEDIGVYKIESYSRMVYIQVEKGREAEQMEKLDSLPFIAKVARVAESGYVN